MALLLVPAAGNAGPASSSDAQATCRLSVFSWWTGGGEAAGPPEADQDLEAANPNCKFKNETVAGGAGSNAKAVLAQRLAAHKPPDSFQGHAGAELRDYIQAKQIVPIDFIYKKYGFAKKVMSKQLVSQITYKGHIYSVPVNIHRANVLWYNPAVLRKAGITAAPKTWNEFIAALDKAKAAGVIPLALGEQWTQEHLLETVMIATIGPTRWAALWKKGARLVEPGRHARAQPLQDAAHVHELRRSLADVAGRWASSWPTARPPSTSWATGRTGTSAARRPEATSR